MESRLRILHLEDSAADAELVAEHLRLSSVDAEITQVSGEADFLGALERGGFDLLLLDYQLPQFDGMRAMEAARRADPHVPVIIVSGVIGDEGAVDLIKAGASDYVLKTRLGRLPISVRRAVAESRRERELRSSRAEGKALEGEVHHRVRNNLQVMSSMLNLQLRHEGDGEAKRALTDAASRLRALAFSHDALYRQPDLAQVELMAFLEGLCANLRALNDAASRGLRIELEGGPLPIAAEGLPWLGLIVNEFLANAVRHGLKGRDACLLHVRAEGGDGEIRIVLSDDGPGFPEAVLSGAEHGVGLRIMGLLARNLGGTLDLANEDGARVVLRLRR